MRGATDQAITQNSGLDRQRRVAPELLEDLRQVAMERPRFGYRRLHVMLRRKGWSVNKKLVVRLVRENGWLVRRRQRKKLAAVPRVAVPQPTRPNEAWAMDFVFDGTAGGRSFRTLNVIDRFTRECLVIEVDTSITGQRVVAVLALLVAMRGKPQSIRIDNGPEFISKALDAWAFEHGIALHFIRPAKPAENGHIESFNGRLRDECLKSELVCRPCRREGEDRALAKGLQRGQAAQLAGLPDADGVHQSTAGSCVKAGLKPGSRSRRLWALWIGLDRRRNHVPRDREPRLTHIAVREQHVAHQCSEATAFPRRLR
jgi:putative transposase